VMLKTKHVVRWGYAPIIDWSEKDVLNYIREHKLPMPPHYRWGIGETCLCPAFMRKNEMMNIKARFPEIFEWYLQLEAEFEKGGAAFYFNDKPTYAKELAKQRTLENFSRRERA